MKYKLIKEYPGSPASGTIVEPGYTGYVPDGQSKNLGSWFLTEHAVLNYPEFWQPISEPVELDIYHINQFIKIEVYRPGGVGGQQVNRMETGVRLTCDEFNFRVECGYHRSMLKNKDFCLRCLKLHLSELPQSVKDHYINEYFKK